MPHGFFTIEQWTPAKRGAKSAWIAIQHLDSDHSLSDAIAAIEKRGNAGLYRVVQTQRLIWSEKVGGKLKLRKWHMGKPESLERNTKAFERDNGVWNVEAAKALRARYKAKLDRQKAKQSQGK